MMQSEKCTQQGSKDPMASFSSPQFVVNLLNSTAVCIPIDAVETLADLHQILRSSIQGCYITSFDVLTQNGHVLYDDDNDSSLNSPIFAAHGYTTLRNAVHVARSTALDCTNASPDESLSQNFHVYLTMRFKRYSDTSAITHVEQFCQLFLPVHPPAITLLAEPSAAHENCDESLEMNESNSCVATSSLPSAKAMPSPSKKHSPRHYPVVRCADTSPVELHRTVFLGEDLMNIPYPRHPYQSSESTGEVLSQKKYTSSSIGCTQESAEPPTAVAPLALDSAADLRHFYSSPAGYAAAVSGGTGFVGMYLAMLCSRPMNLIPCGMLKSMNLSRFNPPTMRSRMQGHLFYLDILAFSPSEAPNSSTVSDADRGVHFFTIAATQKGFYITSSTETTFNVEPMPRNPQLNETLLGLFIDKYPCLLPFARELLKVFASIPAVATLPAPLTISDPWIAVSNITDIDSSIRSPSISPYSQPGRFFSGGSAAAIQGSSGLHAILQARLPSRDWNEDMSAIDLVTKQECSDDIVLQCEREKYHLAVEFARAGLVGAVSFACGQVIAANQYAPREFQYYLKDGIFYSFAVDTKSTFKAIGGDVAVESVALKDLQGIQTVSSKLSSHKFINSLSIVLSAVVDFCGHRVICQAPIPGLLSRSTDVLQRHQFGCLESAGDIPQRVEYNPILAPDLEILAGMLYSKRHTVYDALSVDQARDLFDRQKPPRTSAHRKSACGHDIIDIPLPAAMKIMLGSDGRYFLMDLACVTPRDAEFESRPLHFVRAELIGIFIEAKAREAAEKHEPIPAFTWNLDLWQPHVRCVDLSDGGLTSLAEDEKDHRALSAFLVDTILPRFVQRICFSEVAEPLSGASLVQSMHAAGINVRYLGYLAALATQFAVERQAEINEQKASSLRVADTSSLVSCAVARSLCGLLEQEMIVRVVGSMIKSIVRRSSPERLCPVLACFLSVLLGTALPSVSSISTATSASVEEPKSRKNKKHKKAERHRLAILNADADAFLGDHVPSQITLLKRIAYEIRKKFRYFMDSRSIFRTDIVVSDTIDLSDISPVELPPSSGRICLVRAICVRAGIRLSTALASTDSSLELFDFSCPTPFVGDDIFLLQPRIHQAICHSDLVQTSFNVPLAMLRERGTFKRGMELLLQSLDVMRVVYAGLHASVATCHQVISNTLMDIGDDIGALVHAYTALTIIRRIECVDSASSIRILLHIGNILKRRGQYGAAVHWYAEAASVVRLLSSGFADAVSPALAFARQQIRECVQ